MGELNPRTESFITLLLDTSGRARAGDLQGMPANEAAASLQAYAQAHPERGLVFDGQTLMPPAMQAPSQPAYTAPEVPAAPVPAAVADLASEPVGADVAPVLGEPVAMPSEQLPAAAPAPVHDDFGFGDPPRAAQPAAPIAESEAIGYQAPVSKMAWWWYLIAWFLWPVGGVVGYFVVKSSDPKGARNLLILTVAILLVSCAISAAIMALGGFALSSVTSMTPVP